MSDKLIFVKKDDQVLEVHPDTVEAHKGVGFVVLDNPTAEDKAAAKALVDDLNAAQKEADKAAKEAEKVEEKNAKGK